jgi:hypothetical protein
MSFTPQEIQVVSAIADTASALSIAGSLFILICFGAYPSLRSFSFKLVASLAVTDLLNHVFGFVGPTDTDMAAMNSGTVRISDICYFQAVTESYFNLASVAWVVAIAITLYRGVITRVPQHVLNASYWRYAAACWGIPIIFTALPAMDSAYGPADGWCWIVDDKAYWWFIQFYAPLWMAAFAITYIYVCIICMLRGIVGRSGTMAVDPAVLRIREMISRLKYYPVILVVVWFWASVNRIYEISSGKHLFWLIILQRTFSNSQGLFNALVYGCGAAVRKAIWRSIPATMKKRVCCCVRIDRSDPQHIFGFEYDEDASPVATQHPPFPVPRIQSVHIHTMPLPLPFSSQENILDED